MHSYMKMGLPESPCPSPILSEAERSRRTVDLQPFRRACIMLTELKAVRSAFRTLTGFDLCYGAAEMLHLLRLAWESAI